MANGNNCCIFGCWPRNRYNHFPSQKLMRGTALVVWWDQLWPHFAECKVHNTIQENWKGYRKRPDSGKFGYDTSLKQAVQNFMCMQAFASLMTELLYNRITTARLATKNISSRSIVEWLNNWKGYRKRLKFPPVCPVNPRDSLLNFNNMYKRLIFIQYMIVT